MTHNDNAQAMQSAGISFDTREAVESERDQIVQNLKRLHGFIFAEPHSRPVKPLKIPSLKDILGY